MSIGSGGFLPFPVDLEGFPVLILAAATTAATGSGSALLYLRSLAILHIFNLGCLLHPVDMSLG